MHRVLLRALADALGGDAHAVGEHVAEALALAHQVDQLDHRLVVAEVQVHAAGVLERDDAALEELHGEGDGDAGRHRVEAVLVGGAVGGDDGVGVRDAGDAAERVERLVLGAFGHDAGVGPRLREAHLAAGHGALGAGGAPGAAAGDGPCADGARVLLVPGGRPVVGREDAERGAVLHVAGGALVRELRVEHRAVLHGVEHALARRLELLGVGDGRLLLAAQGDRLEVLGAHHGAEAPAADDAALVDDAGEARELLAGRADAGDAHVLVVQLVLDRLLGVACSACPRAPRRSGSSPCRP